MVHSAFKKKLRCIVIGAGVSGILIAQKLKEAFHDEIEILVLEKNRDVGGTWFENRYPGCANDVSSHIYQYTFMPNPYWSSYHVSSQEIQAYLKAVVFHYGIDKHIRFKSKVERAEWQEEQGCWKVSVANSGDIEAEILFSATGLLNSIQYPRIKNINCFAGKVVHTACWDEDIDLTGKRVAIIGAGASAIQLLPQIQHITESVDIYIRNPSWISPPPPGKEANRERNRVYTQAEIERLRDDPQWSCEMRKSQESSFNSRFRLFIKGTQEQQDVRDELEQYMRDQIHDPKLREKLIPNFDVGCKRINPGEAYLEALQKPNVTPIFDPIQEVTSTGIVSNGVHRAVDVLVCATGFDTSFRPRFPIIGKGGKDLRDLWKDDPTSYFGVAVSGFPNYLMFLGPSTPFSNGSLMGIVEGTADYFVRILKKMSDEQIHSFDVHLSAQTDFDRHTQEMMQYYVQTGSCQSWYKTKSGKITAVWPGSSLHYLQVLQSNRWEDYAWTYRGNRYAHWGRGVSEIEKLDESERDLAYYITPQKNLPLEAYYLAAKGYDRSRSSELCF